MATVKIGTCSWNYPSWVGLVYTRTRGRSAAYLAEYAAKYRTVEVDSWFYRDPADRDVKDYLAQVDPEFTFAAKAPRDLTLTHRPSYGTAAGPALPNPVFLSPERFAAFLAALGPLLPRLDALELEFEYLNRDKMPGLSVFLRHLETFVDSVGPDLPLAIEPRNANYLNEEYFTFLRQKGLAHVFSEKRYLPHIYTLYEQHASLLTDHVVVRLLGGDRAAIEAQTNEQWNAIVDPKPDLPRIAAMLDDLSVTGKKIQVYVNNHFEGSAPLTIGRIGALSATRYNEPRKSDRL